MAKEELIPRPGSEKRAAHKLLRVSQSSSASAMTGTSTQPKGGCSNQPVRSDVPPRAGGSHRHENIRHPGWRVHPGGLVPIPAAAHATIAQSGHQSPFWGGRQVFGGRTYREVCEVYVSRHLPES